MSASYCSKAKFALVGTNFAMESDAVVVANESESPQEESMGNELTVSSSVKQGSVPGDFFDYDMGHRHRGLAYIFVHSEFNSKAWKRDMTDASRLGSSEDQKMLTETLKHLDFQVKSFENLTAGRVRREIAKLAKVDHTHHDCLLVVVSSHGDDGKIYAFDQMYNVEELWEPFTADKCAALAGKPKLFFIQACRGLLRDGGTLVSCSSTAIDGPGELLYNYSIPTQADFLFVYSTIPGYVSYRNQINGSIFIQALCRVLKDRNESDDLLSMVTVVLRSVAVNELQIKDEEKKTIEDVSQMPCFTSQLIRRVYFRPKIPVSKPAKRCRLL